jgi:hypothetical protein
MPEAERQQIWEEKAKLPWFVKTGAELAVDPLSYIGWGIPGMAEKAVAKAGLKTLAKVIHPVTSAEEAFIKVANLPIKGAAAVIKKTAPAIIPDIPYLRATGALRFGKPLAESAQSTVRNFSVHSSNALTNLEVAGDMVGKPFSQILQDFQMGVPDQALLGTLTHPKQLEAIEHLTKNVKNLGLDEIIGIADKNPISAKAIISMKQAGLMAKELGLAQPKLATGLLGSAQGVANKLYSLWRRLVLQTPYYGLQNLVENSIREILVGVRPMWDITDIVNSPGFKEYPIEIQRLCVGLKDRWNKTVPGYLESTLAKTPGEGVLTQAMAGSLSTGKSMPFTTVASFLDATAMAHTYQAKLDLFYKNLMEKTSPETQKALATIKGLYADAMEQTGKQFSWRPVMSKADADIWVKGSDVTQPLYHGTTKANRPGIVKSGFQDYAYLTSDKQYATEYGTQVLETRFRGKVYTIDFNDPKVRQEVLDFAKANPDLATLQDATFEWYLQKHYEVTASGYDATWMKPGAGKPFDFLWDEILVPPEKLKNIVVVGKRPDQLIEQKLVEHLQQVATSGTVDDVVKAFAEVQRNKTFTIARAMTSGEAALPGVIKATIKNELPRAWAKNDVKAIDQLFDKLERTLPQTVETHQKQLLVQRLRTYRDLLRKQLPPQYQPFLTRILNRFKYEKVTEAEAALASATSLTEYERAMFKAHVASRVELETLAEWNLLTDAMANNIPPKTLAQWFVICDDINAVARTEGLKLADQTFSVANVIRHAKDPTKIQQAWDSYIMGIQSLAPDLAYAMRQAAPNTDLLWHTYRATQEQRWFRVGQDKLRQSGINLTGMPKAIDANGKIITQEDFLQNQINAVRGWKDRTIEAWDKRHVAPTAKNKLLDELREATIKAKESIALQERSIHNKASDLALDATYTTFGNYAQRTNLDELMTSIGVPFWFFPSRSIPFYTTQMIQHPRFGAEVYNMQNEVNESEQPSRLFGTINIPGTNYWYNPVQSSMLWQLVNQQNFIPTAVGGGMGPEKLTSMMDWMRNNLSISLGPQWRLGAALAERVMAKQAGTSPLVGEPQPIIPQQRWLDAVAGLNLPVISAATGFLNEPFDMYLRAVYGDEVAEWSKREVEKTIVDMGYNPQTASKEVIQEAWNRYYTRQLLSIPGGAVKEMTPTEMARFEAINQKASELGLTKEQRVTLRELGESPFTGMRQDQLEAMYADIPASKLWRYIRPYGLNARSRPVWEDYIQLKLGRETLLYGADVNHPTKGSRLYNEQQFDKALRAGRISPREWKSLYRQNYAEYVSKVQQLESDYKLAPKTEQDWEAYRQMLGWDKPVRHPDDIKLDEYYSVMDSSNFENDLGEFDFDSYKKAEQQFFAGLPQETVDYIQSRKDRYKTPLRFTYSKDMEKVQPYYSLQDAILAQYPPEVAQLITFVSTVPDPAIQKGILMGNPQALILMRRIRMAKSQFRMKNPEIDRILRYWSS